MNKLLLLSTALLTTTLLTGNTHAKETNQAVTATAVVTSTPKGFIAKSSSSQPRTKTVYLMKVNLTPQQKQTLLNDDTPHTNLMMSASTNKLPPKIDLGMNGVPVLEQGKHGACVTFATTGAIDALLGKGDYISQLCNLSLGKQLANESYFSSGWNGSEGPIILNQILQFGIVNKENQKSKSCGGLTEYPKDNRDNEGNPMSLDDFKSISEDLSGNMLWEPLLTASQRFDLSYIQSYDGNKTLMQVKRSLALALQNTATPMRITFGAILPVDHCSVGACGQYHATGDTWVLSKDIMDDKKPELAGHEMIITGYDDNAVATDSDGVTHQGLLILRNSWGSDVGDQGTFYMSYDYFKKFALEVQEILYTAEIPDV